MVNIGDTLYEFVDSMLDAFHQISLYKKSGKEHKILAKVIMENNRIELYPAQLTPDKLIGYIPSLERVIFKPILYDEGKHKIMYVPNDEITCSNNRIIKDLALSEQNKIWMKWKHGRKFMTTEVFYAGGSINWNLFSTPKKYNIEYSTQTNSVIQAKNLQFLYEISNTKLLLTILASLLFGFISGGVFFTIILKFI